MKARAKQMGFYNGSRVRPGEEFELDGKCPKWADPVDSEQNAPAPESAGKPRGRKARGQDAPEDQEEGAEGLA